MKYDRIIWDFNGTILDDVQVGIDSADVLLERHGLPKILTLEKYHTVFGFPIIDYYKRLGFDFSKVDYSVLAHEWVEIYLEKVKNATVRAGVCEILTKLRAFGVPQSILSMTEEKMLKMQVKDLGVEKYFDEIYGLNDIYASSKLELARNWRSEHPDEKCLYIGDTVHDAESAKIIGADCVLLAGGHESTESLKNHGLPVIGAPKEILDFVY